MSTSKKKNPAKTGQSRLKEPILKNKQQFTEFKRPDYSDMTLQEDDEVYLVTNVDQWFATAPTPPTIKADKNGEIHVFIYNKGLGKVFKTKPADLATRYVVWQLELKDYALFKVDKKAIQSKIVHFALRNNSLVSALCPQVRILDQPKIDSKYLKFINCYKLVRKEFKIH